MAVTGGGRSSSRLPPSRRTRVGWILGVPVVVIVLMTAALAWFDRSEVYEIDIGPASRILLVNDAGPIRIRSTPDGSMNAGLTRYDSWLLDRPRLEVETDTTSTSNEVAVRITCQRTFGCRSSTELSVPAGIELVVVATAGMVEVDRFDGALTVYASDDGLVLGPVGGSLRIVSAGPVRGNDLVTEEIDLLVADDRVELGFVTAPSAISIEAGVEPVVVALPTDEPYRIDVDTGAGAQRVDVVSDPDAERVVVIRSLGPVSVVGSAEG